MIRLSSSKKIIGFAEKKELTGNKPQVESCSKTLS